MESGLDLPITGVCVVSDPSQCPPNYTVIDKTYDRPEDADLWKDGLFTRRVMRYLCVERQIPSQSQDVLVDVTLINERDQTPAGFAVIDQTRDTKEKATKKKCICVRWMIPSMTNDAITELIFVTRTQRRAPMGYSLVGELNNMSLCFKMGKVPRTGGSGPETQPSGPLSQGSGSSALPYSFNPVAAQGAPPVPPRPPIPGQTSVTRPGVLERTLSRTGGAVHALSGIEWKLNPQYKTLMDLKDVTIPFVRGKTLMEIENEYSYDYTVEQSVSRTATLS
ncbi:multivesicular body subunit 12b [Plakobranchus ocellatus]|uniref:Multivesicular body subunit 12b n=1 Tax=Plakobranchus ocellatus TaxID=259542 RepID=A0AAV3ZEB4_9GAST|nr:multivesicular body subunit 12b [Plakobranchus ocellatus]